MVKWSVQLRLIILSVWKTYRVPQTFILQLKCTRDKKLLNLLQGKKYPFFPHHTEKQTNKEKKKRIFFPEKAFHNTAI